MAKQQKEFTGGAPFSKAPNVDKLPDGIVVAQTKAKVYPPKQDGEDSKAYADRRKAEGKRQVIDVFRVTNAAGLKAVWGWLSEHAPGDEFGIEAGIAAANSYLANVTRDVTLENVGDSLTIAPSPSSPNYVDSAAAAGDRITDFIREHGRGPSQDELAEIYASLGVSA